MRVSNVAVLGIAALVKANEPPAYGGSSASSWDLKNFTSLVAFGDSYTDDSRLNYISAHNGSLPPVGYDNPVVSPPFPRRNYRIITTCSTRTTPPLPAVGSGPSTSNNTPASTSTTTPSPAPFAPITSPLVHMSIYRSSSQQYSNTKSQPTSPIISTPNLTEPNSWMSP